MTVRAENTSPLFGSVNPTASKSLKRPVARPSPRKSPTSEATMPIASASTTTEQRTCRREAPERPEGRELARALRDRDRERVDDHERADEERDDAEGEQEVAEEADELVRVLGVLGRLLGAGANLRSGGKDRLDVRHELSLARRRASRRRGSGRACRPCRRTPARSAGRTRRAWRRRSCRPSRT